MGDLLKHTGPHRTDMYCHACSKNFVAELDYSMSGNHQVECPHCGHLHFRQIKDGRVTGERWGSDPNTHIVRRGSVWKSDSQPMVTSTASAFIRDRWVNRSDQG